MSRHTLPFLNTTVRVNGTEITSDGMNLGNTSIVGRYRGTSTLNNGVNVVVVTSSGFLGGQLEKYIILDSVVSWV